MPHNCLQVKPSDVSDESEIETDNLKLKEFHSPLHNIEVDAVLAKFSKHIILLPQSDHVRVLQTVIRNRETPRNEFLFNADCLIRLVVEEGLNQLPYENVCVTTPTGNLYHGIKFLRGNCGVSIMRSGEAMERGLRDCCRSMRIGKILIQKAEENKIIDAKVYYAKFPPNIEHRKVLLMYPILGTGTTVLKALDVLRTYNVPIENVILLTLFASPQSLVNILTRNPALRVVTSEIHPIVPNHFGQRYFGTC
ncbi:Uracil phosphoribosyltransferase isoform 1 [Schistosoma japonicum]|uniref:Uracil phosphoribosyltransferase homolog n=1 Tax=Schistosoma japonicum TaxID=6182 RepID=C1LFX9_SCHJA|nr:Uracil phosphoribosyltransferase isoform 1 [Schistosoma japonicum]TNN13343.1 Uracil phosphoribosyltransferase isoform 1 [Schistosoma japonicum]TNN13344.1 Uracil phosphoribosyltransferase isoform 1 [Schistosoma japonicum]TNN13345.1 Uracil phosphoribosyltransferase isoform 1 [Schistosoma japonicum]CAX73607.1 uracil phosphoribosyltransferase 1 [Schistosoma japonicum]